MKKKQIKSTRKRKKPIVALKRDPIRFPVVGIGASAGGLEAFIALFSKMPADTGMAFVLIQHLDPTHKSLSAAIIAKSTLLKVQEVKDGARVKPNNIYLIPPNHNLSIKQGILNLLPRSEVASQNMSIDIFFKSLAQDQKNRAVGVVLSGTGSDGTLGLKAINAEGGICLVQAPKSAQYDGMPQNAIAAEVADFILPPPDLAKELTRIATNPLVISPEKAAETESGFEEAITKETLADPSLQKIFSLLRAQTNIDFTNYKQATLSRRILRRMVVLKLRDLKSYTGYLKTHPEEVHSLYNEFLINVTEFFRDPEAYKKLTEVVYPQLIKDKTKPIRIWVPGCSTGEEVYSIAISLMEFMEAHGAKNTIQIFASDISEYCVKKARAGFYLENIASNVSKERLKRFFDKTHDGYKVRKMVRDICLFSKHDVTNDPPFGNLNLISCRNLLIYFGLKLQKRVLSLFHFALSPNGFLWLGKAETPAGFPKLFSGVNKASKIYSKTNVRTPNNFNFPARSTIRPKLEIPAKIIVTDIPVASDQFQKDVDKIILSRFAPPSVLVNDDMEILQFRGRIGPFLEPAAGAPSNYLFKMARPEILFGLRSAVQSAKKGNKTVRKEGLHFHVEGKAKELTIEVLITDPNAPAKDRNYLILFEEHSTTTLRDTKNINKNSKKVLGKKSQAVKDQQITELLLELSEHKEYQRTLNEQYDATREELTSTIEELQSTNEEFQSTNEELETAKEELQSTNEELTTVNDEMQIRNADLMTMGSDLNNFLVSTEIPILMVGNDKLIRRFTPNAEKAFNLIPSDVGRPVGHIKSPFGLDFDSLITEVSQKLITKEIEAQNEKGSWKRVQIRPYRTIDNRIDGVIISLVDIESLKQREKSAQEEIAYVNSISETVPLPLAVLDTELKLMSANQAFYKHFEISDQPQRKDIFRILQMPESGLKDLRERLNQVIKSETPLVEFEVNFDVRHIGPKSFLLSANKIQWTGAEPLSVLLSFLDISERKLFEEERNQLLLSEREARFEAEKANRTKDLFLATLSHELRTPLSAILTWAQLIHMGKVDFEKAKQGAFVIEQNAKTQNQLIDDLLDVSRITMNKLALEIKEINPADGINAAVNSVLPLAEKKSIHIETFFSPRPIWILGDLVRMQQIIWNLLTNAIKFSPKNSRIVVRLDSLENQSKHWAQIKVIDQGKGIPEEFLPQIFNRFSQADRTSTRVHGGLGLGLSIVRSLVELQGGTVQVENSRDGTGAIFTTTFPLIPGYTAIVESKSQSQSLEGLRILFVEDDESTREAMAIYLKSFGAELVVVESVKEALNIFSEFKPEILISDIAMPGESGYDLIRKIRELSPEQGGDIPALALTAYATAEDSKRALSAGFQVHMGKPVEINNLIHVVSKLVKKNENKV